MKIIKRIISKIRKEKKYADMSDFWEKTSQREKMDTFTRAAKSADRRQNKLMRKFKKTA